MNFLLPFRFKHFYKEYRNKKFNFLDVGAGSHSASLTKKWFPNCNYYGVDRVKDYENDPKDLALMTKFYQLDVTELKFAIIPDSFFDVLIMSHIIEHLNNGDEVIKMLLTKLKTNGLIYIEFPSIKSTKLPSKKGTLNFYDDDTHIRLYKVDEISQILKENSFKIISAGVRRDWLKVLLTPANMIKSKIELGYIAGGVFWDLLGFADFVFARKT
jgi:ubiquinone/menaquinone biosynthesis C-methylase UbiE